MAYYDVVLAGNIVVDAVKTIDAYPEPLQMANVLRVERAVGGLVGNCAADLARLDPSLSLCAIGRVGADENGRFALSKIREDSGANLDFVKVGGETSITDVMTDATTGERTFFAHRGAGSQLDVEDIPLEELECGIFHLGYALLLDKLDAPDAQYGTKMARVLHDAQKRGFATSLDVVSDRGNRFSQVVPPSLRYADYFAVNELEAERVTGVPLRQGSAPILENLPRACRALKDMGVVRWAVIHMPEVACGMDEAGNFEQVATLKLPEGYICGSVGAGDAFTSALLLCAYRGTSLEEALWAANAVAACSLSMPGASEAVVPVDQALKLYDQFEQRVFHEKKEQTNHAGNAK